MKENELATIVVETAFELHKKIGPGLLEKIYIECLAALLEKRGLKVEKEKKIPFVFEGLTFDCAYRLDLLVEDLLIVEVKSCANIDDIHLAQLLTYLKLTNKKLGLLINFNVPLIKNGIRRVVNGL